MQNTIDVIKAQIKQHSIHAFSALDVNLTGESLRINEFEIDRSQFEDFTDVLGIRNRLARDVMKEPGKNWAPLREALSTINPDHRFGYAINENDRSRVVTVTRTAPVESVQLNYDNRIDSIMNAIDVAKHDFSRAYFNPDDLSFYVDTINPQEVDCGLGDIWKFGTTSKIGMNAQSYSNYFLRMMCINGMTTKENLAYRQADRTKDAGKQYLNHTSKSSFSAMIKPRVERMRKSRASFLELNRIARTLSEDEVDEFMPSWYQETINDYANRGYNLNDMPAKAQGRVYTNVNHYDAFNAATAISSHNRNDIGANKSLRLNAVASSMFIDGPMLGDQYIDIYNN